MKKELTLKQRKIKIMIESLIGSVNSFVDENGNNRFMDLVRTIDSNMSFKARTPDPKRIKDKPKVDLSNEIRKGK